MESLAAARAQVHATLALTAVVAKAAGIDLEADR